METLLKLIRSVRFQVVLITSLLVILGNGFLAVFIVRQYTESLVREKYEKLGQHARYLAQVYIIIDNNTQNNARTQFNAQNQGPDFRSYEDIYAQQRQEWLESPLKDHTGGLMEYSQELGAGFYFSDLQRIMAFQVDPRFIEYDRLVYAVPVDPEGSFVWVEESYHNINIQFNALNQRAFQITFLIILITLFLAGLFTWSFSARMKKILNSLSSLKKDLHSPVPLLSGEFGHITDGIRSLAEALIRTRSRSELILRSAKTGMIAFDLDLNIVMINEAAEQYLECNGNTLSNLEVLDRLGHLISTTIQQAFESGNTYSFDGMRKVVESKEKYFNMTIIPNQGDSDVKMVLVTLEDVSENVKLIKEAEKNESLKMLGLFTTGVAHEIRNPLTSIKGFIQLLNKKMQDQTDNARLLHLVLREIERLENLIKDLITYARPSKPNFEWVPAGPLLDTIVQVLAPRISQKKAEVFQIELDELELFIDRRQMYQVFFNLILNAIQAVPSEDGIIKLRAEKQEHYVDLIVEDNGRGIEKSDFGKIFTPFYTTKDKGTGLGLAISRRMIDDHEGKILFDSIAGEGTIFRIRLFKYRIRKSNDSQALSA